MTYLPPVQEILFTLRDIVGGDRLSAAYPDYDEETAAAVLEGAGRFAAEVLAPLNRSGDLNPARLENGVVRTSPGFAEALRQYGEAGWGGLAADPEFGGQGLPKTIDSAVFEMVCAANTAFSLCPMLTSAGIEALTEHGTERQKRLYLDKLVSGEWTGTMNLTEPQSGSDLATLRTMARPDGEGGYRLHGQKIYITWGDHDAADNIVHMVLARLPGAPEGTRGISLFLAPKRLVNDDGSLGEANALKPVGVEHKLGVHASPTCTMLYEGARAELVGQPNQGLAHMFVMMNAARLNVGVQGVGLAERAYQQALAFAHERRQGRSAWTGEHPAPIHDHPDVRRMLMLMRAKIAAARSICLATAVAADLARRSPGESERRAAKAREDLLTPIAKAWSTDVGVEVASLGVQVHGGMGYIEETGAAQHYRDARIPPIYEGTNGIQAMDLAGRKLALDNGQALADLVSEMRALLPSLEAPLRERLQSGIAAVEDAGAWLLRHRGSPDALAGATAFLQLTGDVLGGFFHGKAALADPARAPLVRFYAAHVLARAPGLLAAVTAGAGDLAGADQAALGAAA